MKEGLKRDISISLLGLLAILLVSSYDGMTIYEYALIISYIFLCYGIIKHRENIRDWYERHKRRS